MHEKKQLSEKSTWLLSIALGIALIGMLGSLYFSDILKFAPCVLCWYQRIALYPLVPLLYLGMMYKDPTVIRYSKPLVYAGLAIAVFHVLLYYGYIPEQFVPCTNGVSCTTKYIELFGFLSIPLLSLGAFSTIAILLGIVEKHTSERN